MELFFTLKIFWKSWPPSFLFITMDKIIRQTGFFFFLLWWATSRKEGRFWIKNKVSTCLTKHKGRLRQVTGVWLDAVTCRSSRTFPITKVPICKSKWRWWWFVPYINLFFFARVLIFFMPKAKKWGRHRGYRWATLMSTRIMDMC